MIQINGKNAPILVHCRLKVNVSKVFSSLTARLCYRLYFNFAKIHFVNLILFYL